MKIVILILAGMLLLGCEDVEHVTPAQFKKSYETIGQLHSMRHTQYLGKREGRAFIRISSMSSVNEKWSDRVIYVDLEELNSQFRESLPKVGME